ncbi:hypothetical protein [Kingella denitrificans]
MLLVSATKNKAPGISSSNAFLVQRLRIASTALVRLTFGQCRLLSNAVKRPQKQPAHQTTHQHTFTSKRRTTMIFAIAAALLTAVLLYMLLFEDWDDFLECVKFWLMPDIISMFRGKYWEDVWAELKLLVWLGISIGVGALVYHNFG